MMMTHVKKRVIKLGKTMESVLRQFWGMGIQV